MRKAILILLTTLILNSINGQNLNGKWLLKDIDSGNEHTGYPGFQLLEIKDSTAEFFTDFSLEKKGLGLKLKNDQILTEKNGKFARYQVVDDNHLKLFIDGKFNDEDAIFECDFYRLMPTITELKKEEIEKMTFIWEESEKIKHELKFKVELKSPEILRIMKIKEGHKLLIEEIDSTLFIGNYHLGEREVSFQIREVTTEFMKLYAIPTGPMEVIAYRKK